MPTRETVRVKLTNELTGQETEHFGLRGDVLVQILPRRCVQATRNGELALYDSDARKVSLERLITEDCLTVSCRSVTQSDISNYFANTCYLDPSGNLRPITDLVERRQAVAAHLRALKAFNSLSSKRGHDKFTLTSPQVAENTNHQYARKLLVCT